MAVAFDAVSESHTGTTGSVNETSFSWTHTPVGTPKGVLVFGFALSSIGPGTAVTITYGGVTVPQLGTTANDNAGEPGSVRIGFLGSGIPTGAQTVNISRLSSSTEMYAVAITVTAANDTAATGATAQSGDQAPAQANIDDGSPGTNSLRFAGAYYGGAAIPIAGANSTALVGIDFGQQTIAVVRETTAGQGSRPVGFADSSDDWACILLAIKEAAAGSSVKTVDGLAVARSEEHTSELQSP